MEPRKAKTAAQDAALLWPHMNQLLLRVTKVEPVQDPVFSYIRFVGRMGHSYLWAAPNLAHRDAVLVDIQRRLNREDEQ